MPRLPFKWHKAVVPLLVPADTIKPHQQNPNNGDVDVVRESVLTNGVYRPIFVSAKTKEIVAGHTQYHVEVELQLEAGIDEPMVPVLFIDGGPAEAKRILAVDNGSAAKAKMDDGLLLQLLRELEAADEGLRGSGYDDDDMAKLDAKVNGGDELGDGDGEPGVGDGELAVIVTCRDEQQQSMLLERFEAEGLVCRALMM
jgi:hypothetical protein